MEENESLKQQARRLETQLNSKLGTNVFAFVCPLWEKSRLVGFRFAGSFAKAVQAVQVKPEAGKAVAEAVASADKAATDMQTEIDSLVNQVGKISENLSPWPV